MAASATLRVSLDHPRQAEAVEAALVPEMGRDVPGSEATLRRDGSDLVVELRAEDGGALRAALNSYLRWLHLALAMHDLASGAPRPPPAGGDAGLPPSGASGGSPSARGHGAS